MTNSFNEINDQSAEIQKNLAQAVNIAKEVPAKINQLLKEKKDLEERTDEIDKLNTDLKTKVSILENKLAEQRTEFEKKLESNDNKIVSLQREFDLAKDDNNKLKDQLKAKDERINILESQKQELTDSLRRQSSQIP
ncbi:MAG: hypothetical protein ACXADY_08955 [Candidatus Hodarchaeales archaeon]|jgi:chromosome segregation ATPase